MRAQNKGMPPGCTRTTFVISEEKLKALKAVAYFEDATFKDVMNAAVDAYLAVRPDYRKLASAAGIKLARNK